MVKFKTYLQKTKLARLKKQPRRPQIYKAINFAASCINTSEILLSPNDENIIKNRF